MLSREFESVALSSQRHGEHNDCSVKAVTILTGLPYATVHAAFKRAGRRDRSGTYTSTTMKAIELLGYRAVPIDLDLKRHLMAVRFNWPCKTLTVKQIEKFNGLWDNEGSVLVKTSGHMLAVENESVHDFTTGTKRRILDAWRIVPAA